MRFQAKDIPDLTGKTVLVTGANSGLGLESVKALAARGAHVLMAARNEQKAREALEEVRAEQPLASLELLPLDLASLASVRRCAEDIQRTYTRLDVLLNNAGVMAPPYTKTADGFELQFGVNHLGHFALTGMLFDLLRSTPGARVVNVSSIAHLTGKMQFDDLDFSKGYRKWPAYGMSKLANLLFTYELARRCKHAGIDVLSVAAHPGYSATQLQQRGAELSGRKLRAKLIATFNPVAGQAPAMGALPQLYAATASGVQTADFIGPSGLLHLRGYPVKVRSSKRSYDAGSMQQLWDASTALTGVRFSALS